MNYSGANMKEQKLDKQMQEHQKIVDEIMTIQGIEPIEAEMEEDDIFDDTVPLPDSFVERMVHKIADSELFKADPLDIPTMINEFVKEHGLPCPNGYIFKDENGNVINAQKIVLEKEKEEDKITLEELKKCMNDYAYWLSKYVRFKDENGNVLKIILKKEKKENPNNFYHCVRTLGLYSHPADASKYKTELIRKFQTLLICRDAYWKIAGEEMGLGKPWEPDWLDDDTKKYVITSTKVFETFGGLGYINYILTFPTEEMRDAFYENFKEEIEECKELL